MGASHSLIPTPSTPAPLPVPASSHWDLLAAPLFSFGVLPHPKSQILMVRRLQQGAGAGSRVAGRCAGIPPVLGALGVVPAHRAAPAASPGPFCPDSPLKVNSRGLGAAENTQLSPGTHCCLAVERRGGSSAGWEHAEESLGLCSPYKNA